jgi:uncharacterized peroxidase-related enzyme
VPVLDDMPDDIRARVLKVQEKSGFIPNVFLMLAYRPEEFRAFMAYHDALMDKEGGLSKAEREMIVVAVSSANQCQYCVVAHGAILRIRARNPLIADQVASNYRKADLTPRQRTMLDFAMKISGSAYEVDASPTTTYGISPPLPRSLACRTAWPISPACARMTSSTRSDADLSSG